MSREKKWTPGPWEVDHACSVGFRDTLAIYHCPNQSHIIEIVEAPDEHNGQCIHGNNEIQRVANAALISAAPDLVSELEEADATICVMCKLLNPQHRECTSCPDRESRLAALAKAYGEIVE